MLLGSTTDFLHCELLKTLINVVLCMSTHAGMVCWLTWIKWDHCFNHQYYSQLCVSCYDSSKWPPWSNFFGAFGPHQNSWFTSCLRKNSRSKILFQIVDLPMRTEKISFWFRIFLNETVRTAVHLWVHLPTNGLIITQLVSIMSIQHRQINGVT